MSGVLDSSGTKLNYYMPPKGFDFLDATNSQLASFAIPPRPNDLTALTQWNNEFSQALNIPLPQ